MPPPRSRSLTDTSLRRQPRSVGSPLQDGAKNCYALPVATHARYLMRARDCGGRSMPRHHRLIIKRGCSSTHARLHELAAADPREWPRRARIFLFCGHFMAYSPLRAACRGRGALVTAPSSPRRCFCVCDEGRGRAQREEELVSGLASSGDAARPLLQPRHGARQGICSRTSITEFVVALFMLPLKLALLCFEMQLQILPLPQATNLL